MTAMMQIGEAQRRIAVYQMDANEARLRGDVAAMCEAMRLAEALAEDVERLRRVRG